MCLISMVIEGKDLRADGIDSVLLGNPSRPTDGLPVRPFETFQIF